MEDYRKSSKPTSDAEFPKTGDVVWDNDHKPWWVIFVWREKLTKTDQRITVQRISTANKPFYAVREQSLMVLNGTEEVLTFKEFRQRFTHDRPEFPPSNAYPGAEEPQTYNMDWTSVKNTLEEMMQKINSGSFSDADLKLYTKKLTKPRK